MDRNKMIPLKRGPKVKTLPLPGDFIVLGSKSSKQGLDTLDVKLASSSHKGSSSQGNNGDRKREAASSSPTPLGPLAKKAKLSTSVSTSGSSIEIKKESNRSDLWDANAIEVDPNQLVNMVIAAEETMDGEKCERLLCGAVRILRSNRSKSEPSLYLGLMLLVKTRPVLFCSDYVTEAFSSLLKREAGVGIKGKGNVLVPLLAANVMMAAYHKEEHWPEVFVKVYLEDALFDRVWVDHCECRGFVDNILTAFNTKTPPKNFLPPELTFKPDVASSPPSASQEVDDDAGDLLQIGEAKSFTDITIFSRYSRMQDMIEVYVMDSVREQVNKRQPVDNVSRNLLKVLSCTCGLSEVRVLVSQRLEMWLQNPKLTRPAQELLLSVCINCNQHHQQDLEAIGHLLKIRLKTKLLINHYLQCIRELLSQHPENIATSVKTIIYNELSNSRNPNNMALLAVVFQHSPELVAKILSEIFQEVLTHKDDYLRALRVLFREIARSLRYELNFHAFCLGLMQERKELTIKDMEQSLRDRWFLSITDLITLSIFLGITPAVKEAASSNARGDKRDVAVLRNFQKQASEIQRDAVWWIYLIVPKFLKPGKNELMHCLHKVLFMEQPEHYYNKDNWPSEADRNSMLRLSSEVPLAEDTIMKLLQMGLSKDHILNATDCLELVDQLIRRAAASYSDDFAVLEIQSDEIFEALFSLSIYRHPENIALPSGYQPPSLAISNLYWKTWTLLLIIAAHNPSIIGSIGWNEYPTLRCLMEMCITNHFTYPPPTMGDNVEELRSKEIQICQIEKQEILEFESHLASASTNVVINENNSLLLSQLVTFDPRGVSRRPPSQIVTRLKSLNQTLKLGHFLCRTRNPDFLLDIIQNQGTSQSMPWLADLVESSEGAYDMLPVQCLCEFLLNEGPLSDSVNDDRDDSKVDKAKRKEKSKKQQHLLQHLRELLYNEAHPAQSTLGVLDYFLRRLSSQQKSSRQHATKGLSVVLAPPTTKVDDEDEDELIVSEDEASNKNTWLLKYLPTLPHFELIKGPTAVAVRQACLVENDHVVISGYIQFLSEFTSNDPLPELVDLTLDIAQMIIERTTIMNFLLPFTNESTTESTVLACLTEIFVKYVRKAREPSQEAYSWSEAQDHILIQWATGEAATMHIFVVHAMVVLLTYGPPLDSELFDELLEIWFPTNSPPPQAFLVDTSEEALLYPDWLKLRMIRSNVAELVDAALKDLDPSQLVLFIQSFGIPISSVSKLLRALDESVHYNSELVEQAVVDKSYMAKLVEVQQQRGAQHGDVFAHYLGLQDSEEMEENDESIQETNVLSRIKRSSPIVVMPQPKLLPALNQEDVYDKLVAIFDAHTAIISGRRTESINLIRSIQKSIASEIHKSLPERSTTNQLIAFLSTIFDIKNGPLLCESLKKNHTFSCPIFRLLLTIYCKHEKASDVCTIKFVEICKKIIEYSQDGKTSPLISLIGQCRYLSIKNIESSTERRWNQILKDIDSSTHIDAALVNKIIRETVGCSPGYVEQAIQKLIHKAIETTNTKAVITAFTEFLVTSENNHTSFNNLATARLVLDCLELLEPEVISSIPELQNHLLFKTQIFERGINNSPNSSRDTCRPYLLASLVHQTNWATLSKCIDLLLTADSNNLEVKVKYEPIVVLDFLWTCIYIPKIWQGRDKHLPKHYKEENVLGLNVAQVIQVSNYILVAVENYLNNIEKNSETAQKHRREKQYQNPIVAYLPILVYNCSQRKAILKDLVDYLISLTELNGSHAKNAHELLLHLYRQIPHLIEFIDKPSVFFKNSACISKFPSQLDSVSHSLLTTMADTESVREWKEKKKSVELACRKMASTHPILMLRQLGMIASSLRGRVQFEFTIFRSRNHLAYFNSILSLLENFQPYLYRPEYGTWLEDVFDSYFDLIKTHGNQRKELSAVIMKFLYSLVDFMSFNTPRATKYIQKHISVLNDLSTVYSENSVLSSMISALSLPRHLTSSNENQCQSPPKITFSPPTSQVIWTPAHLQSIALRLSNVNNSEDILLALHDLDSMSVRKVSVLEYFLNDLKRLMIHPTESCRHLTLNLMMKLIKHKPSLAKNFMDAFLTCLESDHLEIVTSTLEKLSEFVLLCQEHASVLLQRTFLLSLTGNINTAPYLGEMITLLNMQAGC